MAMVLDNNAGTICYRLCCVYPFKGMGNQEDLVESVGDDGPCRPSYIPVLAGIPLGRFCLEK